MGHDCCVELVESYFSVSDLGFFAYFGSTDMQWSAVLGSGVENLCGRKVGYLYSSQSVEDRRLLMLESSP